MKKAIPLVLAIVMLSGCLPGCASFGTWSSGAQAIVDFVCTPTDAEKADAAKWLSGLDLIQAGVSAFFPAAGIVKASAVMTTLKNGGCFFLSEVQAAIDLLTSMQAKQATMLAAKSVPRAAEVQFPALMARIKAGK